MMAALAEHEARRRKEKKRDRRRWRRPTTTTILILLLRVALEANNNGQVGELMAAQFASQRPANQPGRLHEPQEHAPSL
jgi:hypothetical protein